MNSPWANAEELEEAGFVLFDVPDESDSSAEHKSASHAPKRIRGAPGGGRSSRGTALHLLSNEGSVD
jgi:hypothetical protein